MKQTDTEEERQVSHTAKSIIRFSVVRYKDKLFVLENAGKNKAYLIYDNAEGKRCAKEIEKDTLLEVVKYPAQLAFAYLKINQ